MNQHTTRPAPLTFKTDRGASRSFWLALALLVLIIGWIGSGFFIKPPAPEPVASAEIVPPTVMVRASQAQPVTLNFRAEGQAQPDRDTSLRAEVSGTVVEVVARKGTDVEAGAVIARLSSDQAEATLAQAKEELARASREFDNASALRERGVATADRVSEARADRASAEAALTAAEVALDDLIVAAPFSGRIETLPINDGEFVAAGEEIARLVDNDPLTVTIQVPQQSLNRIKTGQTAMVRFITGQERQGEVSFVGTAAAASTRTFLAEIEIANPGGEIPAGISAEITIPTGEERAHFVESSIVSLSPEGELGVKLEENGAVRFVPIEVANADKGGVWATGLPEKARIITIGQGFVRDGETVTAQAELAASPAGPDANPPATAPAAPAASGAPGAQAGDTSALTANDAPGSAALAPGADANEGGELAGAGR